MKNFYLFSDHARIILDNGNVLVIHFTPQTGAIFYRYKINTISQVRHPGVLLGVDSNGCRWYMHNHFEHGRPVLEVEHGFAKGQSLYVAERQPNIGYLAILKNGLEEILRGTPYDWLSYNCQVFVNRIAFNEDKSEAVQNWAGGIAIGALLFLGIGVFTNSK